MNKLENITKELTDFSSQLEVTMPEISAASIGWHIEHTLLVTNSIINVLKKSDPNDLIGCHERMERYRSGYGRTVQTKVKASKQLS